jgi:ABC-2 type transport system permease protein
MRKTFLVLIHEFVRHVRRPSFVITTVLVPLILGALILIPSIATSGLGSEAAGIRDAPALIGYVDASGVLPTDAPSSNLRAFATTEDAEQALRQGSITGFYAFAANYLDSGAVTWVGGDEHGATPQRQSALTALVRASLLDADPALVERLATPLALRFVPAEPVAADPPAEAGDETVALFSLDFALPYIFALLLYLTIFSSASFLLQSVTEEKENRTIEIILNALPAYQLLIGKVVGLGLLGVVQVVFWIGSGALLLTLSGAAPATARLTISWGLVGLALIYYSLGFLVYGSLLAAIGATVTNMREGSQLLLVLIIPCLLPLWMMSAIIAAPHSLLATTLSLFPLTAPVTMMIRAPLTTIAPWEITLSIITLTLGAGLALWLAARLFRAGTLLAGQRLRMRAVLRALRTN